MVIARPQSTRDVRSALLHVLDRTAKLLQHYPGGFVPTMTWCNSIHYASCDARLFLAVPRPRRKLRAASVQTRDKAYFLAGRTEIQIRCGAAQVVSATVSDPFLQSFDFHEWLEDVLMVVITLRLETCR